MKRFQPVLAASLSVLVGLVALASVAEARGGGGGGGGFHGGGFVGGGGGFGGRGGGFDGGRNAWGPGGSGYGAYPGRPNPYARNPNIFIDGTGAYSYSYGGYQVPPNNSGSSPPNDCDYLFKKAVDSSDPTYWNLYNDCSHGR
jgi:hypothetical protein